ncbi:MAG TPA: dockerin type I domain-containing protein, partial [Candidatus Bathyarchaeia archaeon]|nr:dockerin type I domain-containing protein [Candidatus Bathyarchaeia archaeon]
HRQIVFCQDRQTQDYACQRGEGISIEGGRSYDFDFSGRLLSFGDIDQNGSVGVTDWSLLLACRNEDAKKGSEAYEQGGCKRADANFDGEVNNFDIDLFQRTLSNYPDDE